MKRWLIVAVSGIVLFSASLLVGAAGAPQRAGASQGNLPDSTLEAAGAPACPQGGTCLAMPCPTANQCGVVETSPASNLGPNQWVYLHLYGFPAQTSLQIYYCSENSTVVTLQAPYSGTASGRLCSFEGTSQQPIAMPTVQTLADGTLDYSFQTEENVYDPTATAPCLGIGGQIPGVPGQVGQCLESDGVTQDPNFHQFFCDTSGQNNCDIVIVNPSLGPDPGSTTPNDQNSINIPVAFQNSSSACASATQLLAEGDWGPDLLLGATDQATCQAKGSAAVVPFYTAENGLTALNLLEKGSIQLAFTDDAQSSTQQAYFKRDGFLSIPIALSATTVGYLAQMQYQGTSVPESGIELSANMAAGILSGVYGSPLSSDLGPCSYGAECPFLASVNNQAGYQQNLTLFGGYIRSDTAGVTDQMLSWMCKSPAMNITFPQSIGGSGIESATAEQVLLGGYFPNGGAPSGCLNTDQIPAFVPQNQYFGLYSNPSIQSLKLTQFVASCTTNPCSGFGIFNLAEAEYYGLSTAALQNGSGNFVAPTADGITAGVKACSWDTNGVCTPNYADTSDPKEYPMTSVISAVVPRNPNMSATDKANLQAALTSILDITTNPSSSTSLPAGMVPLPANIATVARDEVANGIANPSYSAPIPAGASGSTSRSNSSYRSSSFTSSLGALGASGSTSAGAATRAKIPSSSPTYGPFTLSASVSRLLLPATVLLGLILAVFGVTMMGVSVAAARRRAAVAAAEETGGLEPEGDGPEGEA